MGLALVMIKENTGGAMHLRDDHPFGAIDAKSASVGHHGQVAHVNVLFLDIENAAGFGFFVNFKYDQAQCHAQRGRIGHVPLLAFFRIIFWGFQIIGNKFQRCRPGKIRNWKNRFKNPLQAIVHTFASGNIRL